MMDNRMMWEERNAIIVHLIRVHSMVNLEGKGIEVMLKTANRLRNIEELGGGCSDAVLLQQYMEELENEA